MFYDEYPSSLFSPFEYIVRYALIQEPCLSILTVNDTSYHHTAITQAYDMLSFTITFMLGFLP